MGQFQVQVRSCGFVHPGGSAESKVIDGKDRGCAFALPSLRPGASDGSGYCSTDFASVYHSTSAVDALNDHGRRPAQLIPPWPSGAMIDTIDTDGVVRTISTLMAWFLVGIVASGKAGL